MRHLVFLALPLALCACSTVSDGYPSLLPRPIESRDAGEVVRPDPVVTPDAALESRITEQVAAADRIATRFRSLAMETESRVAIARGVAPGGESWVAAQVALADLNGVRGETVAIVTSLEATAAERLSAGTPPIPRSTRQSPNFPASPPNRLKRFRRSRMPWPSNSQGRSLFRLRNTGRIVA
ncbi:hypothetical protein LRS12_18060 [Sphingomonas sp. J344]|uniref:hypothetical protein n=1 Tax=Sphingomonas sp. J344 TaxID=2898434 RepID=UPI002151B4CE|nr:hypothetical protein [Sphingomonas sp. J344]MCR5872441.1 hypothetical protein [Sphingomonas sp. J344]